jgi:hypothetical protein
MKSGRPAFTSSACVQVMQCGLPLITSRRAPLISLAVRCPDTAKRNNTIALIFIIRFLFTGRDGAEHVTLLTNKGGQKPKFGKTISIG